MRGILPSSWPKSAAPDGWMVEKVRKDKRRLAVTLPAAEQWRRDFIAAVVIRKGKQSSQEAENREQCRTAHVDRSLIADGSEGVAESER